MHDAPQPRSSFWRFSLREMLLVMLAIAAFLGWGRAIYQRYKRFTPTPFLSQLDMSSEVILVRQQVGELPASWSSSSAGTSGGPRGYERDFRLTFPLSPDKGDAFIKGLQQRMRDRLDAHGCQIEGAGHGRTGNTQEFRLRYVRDIVEGSLRVILIPGGDQARLLVFVEERRRPP